MLKTVLAISIFTFTSLFNVQTGTMSQAEAFGTKSQIEEAKKCKKMKGIRCPDVRRM